MWAMFLMLLRISHGRVTMVNMVLFTSARALIRSFRKDADVYPVRYPSLPTPPTGAGANEIKGIFNLWTREWERVRKANSDNFERALPRIKLCALLHGMTFSSPGRNLRDEEAGFLPRHYTWCPASEWWNADSKIVGGDGPHPSL